MPRSDATLHCSVKSSEISSINPESVHTIVVGPSFLAEVRLYQLEVAVRHRLHDRGRWCRPEIGVEDLDLDVAAIARGGNGSCESGKVDVAVAHHAAGQQGVRR